MNKKKYCSIFFIALFLSILPQCKLAAQEQIAQEDYYKGYINTFLVDHK